MPWERAAWHCQQYLDQLQKERKALMVKRWKESFQQKCDPYASRSHRYVSGKCKYQPFRGIAIDGVFQVDAVTVDNEMRSRWVGIHKLRGTDPETVLSTFAEKYERLVPQHDDDEWQPITATNLMDALRRTRTHTSAGPCGWRVSELRKLPLRAWTQMALIFNVAEEIGELPRLCQALWQTPIPKVENDATITALDIRPISVYSVLYRIYAKARYQTLKAAFARVVHPDQFGGMEGKQIADPILTMVRDLELAEIKQRADGPVYPDIDAAESKPHWITYDLTKAFDTVHPWLACRVLEICGYNRRFVRSYRHHLVHNNRRWKLPQRGLGEAWCSTTGIAQGCPLSAMSAVAVYSIITRHIHEKVAIAGGSVQVLSYIDDFSIGAADLGSLETARAAMQEIIDDFGMTINEKKTKVISVVPQLHEILENEGLHMPYDQTSEHKVLGVIMGVGDKCPGLPKYGEDKSI
eukprot:6488648-Amphidinium_carterae.4